MTSDWTTSSDSSKIHSTIVSRPHSYFSTVATAVTVKNVAYLAASVW